MTVRELIAELQKHDQDSVVVLQLGRNELGNGREVRRADTVRARMDCDDVWQHLDWMGEYEQDGYEFSNPTTVINLTT